MISSKRSLLEQLFNGNFIPTEHIRPQDPAFQPTSEEAEKEYLYLCQLLNEDDRKYFGHLLELNLRMSAMDSCASFCCGFRYGALLMLEFMDAKDALYACP